MEALVNAYVAQKRREHARKTRGYADHEQCKVWEVEAHQIVHRVRAEAILMDGFDMAVADRLADAGYTEYAEDEDGGVTWVSAPLGEVLHIVRVCATEYETGDRA